MTSLSVATWLYGYKRSLAKFVKKKKKVKTLWTDNTLLLCKKHLFITISFHIITSYWSILFYWHGSSMPLFSTNFGTTYELKILYHYTVLQSDTNHSDTRSLQTWGTWVPFGIQTSSQRLNLPEIFLVLPSLCDWHILRHCLW